MTLSLGAAAAQPAQGRNAGQTPGGGSGQFGGTGADPLRFRQLTMNALRAKLAPASEEEWKSLWPKVENVLEAQRNARTGAAMSLSSPGMVKGNPPVHVAVPPQGVAGGGGGGVAHVETPAGRAMQLIRAALDQQWSDAELIETVAAMRAARDKARAELVAAQKELHDACSPRQEAVLVTLGVLE